jgi:hypothetical protein
MSSSNRYERALKTPQISLNNAIHFAEVRFYFTKSLGGETRAFALISPYSSSEEYLLQVSQGTLVVCRYPDVDTLWVIDVASILSVVAMIPFPFLINGQNNYYYMVEKIGLDIVDADTREGNE